MKGVSDIQGGAHPAKLMMLIITFTSQNNNSNKVFLFVCLHCIHLVSDLFYVSFPFSTSFTFVILASEWIEFIIFPVVEQKHVLMQMIYYPASAWIVHNPKFRLFQTNVQT